MINFGLSGEFNLTVVFWWLYLAGVWWAVHKLVGLAKVNTFSFFFPLLLITNGILIPFTRELNRVLTAVEIHTFNEFWAGLGLMYASIPIGIISANLLFR